MQDKDSIQNEINKVVSKAKSLTELNDLKLKYLSGKASVLNTLTASLKELKSEERAMEGVKLNQLKETIEQLFAKKKEELLESTDSEEDIDVTLPAPKPIIGHLSPDTQVIRMMNEFFIYHGYSIADGPDIESDEFNFGRTNLPKDHPARDLQDTIYIESPEVLLRTHTSSVETRILSSNKPPLRFVVPGVSYRNELINPSNHSIFYQYQGVCVDKGISIANLKATLENFARYMYGDNVTTRFRTKYYPEVEPGGGLDVMCAFCKGEGCRICKGRGWLEILGCGMIHRNLLKKCGIDFDEWSGFAFGMGLDRIIMTKFGIEDIRNLHGGGLVYEDTL